MGIKHFSFSVIVTFLLCIPLFAQEEEPIRYYQLEPLDDSLFIKIQEELFIDPPDPKAEIIADLRDLSNQTISVKGALYPFLALSEETRSRIITYPFKISLEESITYTSLFTRVINKLRFDKIINTPTALQISSTLGYINPFLQFMGGERFGFALKNDVGFSFGIGTPYSGVLETNFYELNFHILGLRAGLFSNDDTFIEHKFSNNHNNIYFKLGYQINYVVPFGNFFEFGYMSTIEEFGRTKVEKYRPPESIVISKDGSKIYDPYLVDGTFFNWEFRYPIKVLEGTRGKIYVAKYVNEYHIGFTGREMSLAGSVFDFRFDAMVSSKEREPQYVIEALVQKIFGSWAFSAVAIGPSVILTKTDKDKFGITSIFVNARLKAGTSF
ncbi:Hypothetical protein IALB_1418 [Ignavibacterium album JCM 16511]|uniref:Uncharacterized protein n=1 Tax=Ignavibacterium album (strain DSM 19864 / JCM 16511 / NBRC 101810 / Mat9-16) TaxID=945713 RepID=I0AJH1_IGNAJ|nr:hypothetical protein [Ignavibacterium album]AFH49128.1 Hypothetical protein IALB_1418 [Ignavibacterium album JCM 16511]